MSQVKVTELRQNLPSYLLEARKGKEIEVTSRGKVIARIVPAQDEREAARKRLLELRKKCRIGDIMSPSGDLWNAQLGKF